MASANKLLHIYYASITTYLNLKTQAGTWSHTNHFFGRLPFQIWIAQQSGFMWPFSLIRNLEISTWLLLAGLFVAKLVSVVGSEMALKSRNINHLKHQIHWGTRWMSPAFRTVLSKSGARRIWKALWQGAFHFLLLRICFSKFLKRKNNIFISGRDLDSAFR